MTIYNFYFFNRNGKCIYYKEWKREKHSGISDRTEEFKLMFGMLSSLCSFAERLSTKEGQQVVRHFRTSSYKLTYIDTPTGLRMALNTDPYAAGIPELMKQIYRIYVDTVLRNPLLDTSEKIESELFASRLDQVIIHHSAYA
ncbi:hypothetical protein WR25_18054 [Diploscapter pachys]|uniref:Trafficking protein particle complex subunit n=1 Tax=Diploscapter pachys TaxID=2018661 RepID=A0A2A2JE11_9BILA|nr:hypothetical protein WR25_18054 [Diploscapter pachys]